MSPPATPPHLSLVVPVHDEEENIRPLWAEIVEVLDGLPFASEVLYVNDGSTDATSALLDDLRAQDDRVRVLDHDRNHGLTAALDCGFHHVRGAVVAMIDGDGQNPPAELPKLLDHLERTGADMVIGWRRDRNDSWLRRVSSRVANGYRNWRTHEQVHDVGCGLKVFRAEVARRVKLFDGLHRFLPTLARMEGFRVEEIVVAHRPRERGRSHYGVWNRVFKGMRDTKAVRWMWANRLTWKATERGAPDAGGEESSR